MHYVLYERGKLPKAGVHAFTTAGCFWAFETIFGGSFSLVTTCKRFSSTCTGFPLPLFSFLATHAPTMVHSVASWSSLLNVQCEQAQNRDVPAGQHNKQGRESGRQRVQ